jgi:hypothetical protein
MIIAIIILAILIWVGIFFLILWVTRWETSLDYARKKVYVWYKGDIIESFHFFHGNEQEILNKAKNWIKENKERI